MIDNIEQYQNAITALRAHAERDGDDFRVKVSRRQSSSAPAEHLALLGGATLEQIVNAESWLSQLAGGSSHYVLQVYHTKNPTDAIATLVPPQIGGQPRTVDPRVVSSPEWIGPKILVFPAAGAVPAGAALPLAPNGSASQRTPPNGGGEGQLTDGTPMAILMAKEQEIQRREREMIEREARNARDADRRENEAAIKRLEAKLVEALSAARTPVADPNAPLIQMLMQSQETSRMEIAKMQAENMRMLQAQIAAMTESSRAPNPMLEKVMELSIARSEDAAKMVAIQNDSMSKVMNTMVQTVSTMMELGLGRKEEAKEDGGLLGIVRETVGAFMASAAAQRQNAQQPTPVVQSRPAPRQIAQPPQPPRAPQAQPPVVPVPLHAVPQPPAGATATSQPAFAGFDDEPAGPPSLDEIAEEIRNYRNPEDVAEMFLDALQFNPDAGREFAECGGDASQLFQNRLGTWLTEDARNITYTESLLTFVVSGAEARGAHMEEDPAPEGGANASL